MARQLLQRMIPSSNPAARVEALRLDGASSPFADAKPLPWDLPADSGSITGLLVMEDEDDEDFDDEDEGFDDDEGEFEEEEEFEEDEDFLEDDDEDLDDEGNADDEEEDDDL